MKNPLGRPPKYGHLIKQLDQHTLYCPASIAQWARDNDYFQGETDAKRKLQYQRIRIALGRFSNNKKFPDEGDGMVTLTGQAPCPGWFGWRWQQSYLPVSS